mmetsp:Transcript_17294/g.56594  ORF Transcript_17294/g.56594 Transcript_17294/m.56594 type:complete len:269 (+) Transcript_17294:34-840(+)
MADDGDQFLWAVDLRDVAAKLNGDRESLAWRVQHMKPLTNLILGWTALFLVVRFVLFPRQTSRSANRIVSIVHAVVALYYATLALPDLSAPFDSIGGPNTDAQMRCLVVSLGYFIYDLFCDLANEGMGAADNALHHLCTILGLAYGLASGTCATELVECLWLMETSNPSLHMRSILLDNGTRAPPAEGEEKGKLTPALPGFFEINQQVFGILFLVCRLVIGPVVVFKTVTSPTSHPIVKLMGIGIQVVSLMWFGKILSMLGGSKKKKA